jgi:hypothetical protein
MPLLGQLLTGRAALIGVFRTVTRTVSEASKDLARFSRTIRLSVDKSGRFRRISPCLKSTYDQRPLLPADAQTPEKWIATILQLK